MGPPATQRQWQRDRTGSIRVLWVITAYLGLLAISAWWLFVLLVPDLHLAWRPVGLIGLYSAYMGLWALRLMPKYRRSSLWREARFSWPDVIFLALLLALMATM